MSTTVIQVSPPQTTHHTPDGRTAIIRLETASDRAMYIAAVDALSPTSRYQRFFSPIRHLTDRDVDRLMDLDARHQVVYIATDESGAVGLGVGRFTFISANRAEVAVAVADAWQGQGLGGALLDRVIAAARERGLTALVAESLTENRAVAVLLRSRGFARRGPVSLTVRWELPLTAASVAPVPPPEPSPARRCERPAR